MARSTLKTTAKSKTTKSAAKSGAKKPTAVPGEHQPKDAVVIQMIPLNLSGWWRCDRSLNLTIPKLRSKHSEWMRCTAVAGL